MKDKLMNLLLLLAVGAALGVSLLRPADTPTAALPPLTALPTAVCTPSPPPAQAYRAQRLAVRAQEQEGLESLLQSGALSAESRALAEAQALSIAQNQETELCVEAALAALGYADALCAAREESLNIFVPQTLEAAQAQLLLEVAQEASGLAAERIRIAVFP